MRHKAYKTDYSWHYLQIKERLKNAFIKDGFSRSFYGDYLGKEALYSLLFEFRVGDPPNCSSRGSKKDWRDWHIVLETHGTWLKFYQFYLCSVDIYEWNKIK